MKRIIVETPGGPEQMKLVEAPKPSPGPKEAVVAVAYSGVNFHRRVLPHRPLQGGRADRARQRGLGHGRERGTDVTEVAPGDRVAYTMVRGSYAEYAVVPGRAAGQDPRRRRFRDAAAVMLQGTTAHYLTHSTFPLKAGDTCLVHAAAGGTGGLIVQMAKHRGARVFGTVSTEEKARQVRELGADEAILYTTQDFEAEVKRLTERPRRRRRLRLGRQDDVRQEPERAAPARHDGALWPVERLGAALRSRHPQRARLAVPHAPKPRAPSARSPGTALARRRRARVRRRRARSRCGSPGRIRCPKRQRPTRSSRAARRRGSCC